MNIHTRPRSVETCTNGMLPQKPSLADRLLASLNSEGEAHIVSDTTIRTWSPVFYKNEENNREHNCNEVRLRVQCDGKYSLFIGYTNKSGRFLDCHGYLGATKECVYNALKGVA